MRNKILFFLLVLMMTSSVSCSTSKPVDPNATACFNTLNRINLAKRSMAMGHALQDGATLTQDQIETLGNYLQGGNWSQSQCPSGGEYTIGKIGIRPTCSIHGDVRNQRTSRNGESQ